MGHDSEATRWTMIRGAAEGRAADREAFARRYEPIVRAYLGARWRGTALLDEIDDAAQEAFLACFREGGALARVDPDAPGKFRNFLYGVVLNVARRLEEKRARHLARRRGDDLDLQAFEADEETASHAFDRAWASAILRQAADLQAERAADDAAARRVAILGMRFGEGLPIREIAARLEEDPARVHREYAKARREFRVALRDVVRTEDGGRAEAIDAECARLIEHFR